MNNQTHANFLIIIPARGGSKGVPRKNLRAVGGLPLIDWSIRSGQESSHSKTVVVSTDDEIAHVVKRSGAMVVVVWPVKQTDP